MWQSRPLWIRATITEILQIFTPYHSVLLVLNLSTEKTCIAFYIDMDTYHMDLFLTKLLILAALGNLVQAAGV